MTNWDIAEKATQTAMNSQGSAMREQEAYLDSINGKVNQFKAAFQSLSNNTISSDFVKGIVDGGTKALDILNQIISATGVLTPALATLGGVALFKNFDKLKNMGNILTTLKTGGNISNVLLGTGSIDSAIDALKGIKNIDADQKLRLVKEAFGEIDEASARAALGITGVGKSASTASTATASVSAAFKGLGATMKAILFNPYTYLIAGAAAATVAVYKLATAGKKATEDMKSSMSALESSQSNVDSLNNELDNTNSRISELEAKPSLTFVEQSELENLRAVTRELELQLDLAKKQEKSNAGKLAEDTVKAFEKNQGRYIEDLNDKRIEAMASNNKLSYLEMADEQNIAASLATIQNAKQLMEETKDLAEKNRYQDIINEATDSVWDQVSKMNEQLQNLNTAEDVGKLTKEQKKVQQTLQDSIEYVYEMLDPTLWKSMQMDEIFSDDAFIGLRDKLTSVAQESSSVSEVVNVLTSQYPELAQAVKSAGMELDTFAEGLMSEGVEGVAEFKKALSGDGKDTILDGYGVSIEQLGKELKSFKLSDIEFFDALTMDGAQKGEHAVQGLYEAALKLGLISGNSTEEIQKLVDVLADAGLISSTTAGGFEGLAESISQVTGRVSILKGEISDLDANPIFDSVGVADETKNAGDDYLKAAEYLKQAKEMYDQGLVGTDDFKSRASYFSPTQSDDAENFIENYSRAARYLTEDSSGVKNFLSDLESKGYATFEKLSDGTQKWKFDIVDLEEASQRMGVGFEFFMDMFGRLEDYGFSNNFVASIEDGANRITDLTTQLVMEQAKLAEMETTGFYTTIDENGNQQKTLANQTAIDAQREKVNALKNDINETNDAMQQLVAHSAEDYNQQVESAKQAISSLKAERDKVLAENTYGSNTDAVVKMMDAQIQQWATNAGITLDAQLNIQEPSPYELQVNTDQLDAAVSTLNEITGSNFKLDLVSDVAGYDQQIREITGILDSLKKNGEIDLSVDGAEQAITILKALSVQKAQVSKPAIMHVDTGQLSGDASTVVSLLQQIQTAYDELQQAKTLQRAGVDVDVSAAEAKLEGLTTQLQNLPEGQAQILADLKVNTESANPSYIAAQIGQIPIPAILKVAPMSQEALTANGFINYELGNVEEPDDVTKKVNYSLGKVGKPSDVTRTVNYSLGRVAKPDDVTVGVSYYIKNPLPSISFKTGDYHTGTMLSPARSKGTFSSLWSDYKALAYGSGKVALNKNESALVNELGENKFAAILYRKPA